MNYEDNWYVRKIDHDLLQYIVLVVSISNSPKFSTHSCHSKFYRLLKFLLRLLLFLKFKIFESIKIETIDRLLLIDATRDITPLPLHEQRNQSIACCRYTTQTHTHNTTTNNNNNSHDDE